MKPRIASRFVGLEVYRARAANSLAEAGIGLLQDGASPEARAMEEHRGRQLETLSRVRRYNRERPLEPLGYLQPTLKRGMRETWLRVQPRGRYSTNRASKKNPGRFTITAMVEAAASLRENRGL